MSAGNHIKPESTYLKELIRLRDEGYSWSAIGRYFNKDHTTIQYHYNRWVGKPSKTKTQMRYGPVKKISIQPSWDGHKHICCQSFVRQKHTKDCQNVAGEWTPPPAYQNHFKDYKAVAVNKYDHLFDDEKRLGKSYAQYRLTK